MLSNMKDILKAIVFIGLFAIPFLPIYVESSYFFPYITGKNFAFRIIIEIAFAAWVLLALYDKQYRPRFSWLLSGFGALIVVMFAADLFGEYPLKSIWSNYERMDGFVTLAHLFLYFVVLSSSITTQKVWNYLFHTSLAIALVVAVYGLMQQAGLAGPAGGRVESWLGNAAYMAIYMLFHIFIAFYLFVRAKMNWQGLSYALLAGLFVFTLLLTGTRGTFLGFLGGSFVTVAYIAIFGAKYPQFRKYAAAGFVGLTLLAAGFFVVKDSTFVQSSPSLSRIANIDIASDLTIRGVIWGMALEGVKERPVLGWGQSGFSYVFNKQYEPALWGQEAWFDRVHNIFLDWLIAGGVLGLLAYLSIFGAAFYYLFWQPLRTPKESHTFNVLERGVIIGLLSGYFVHNLVVFDNIVSYIFFVIILALIHSRVSTPWTKVQNCKIDEKMIVQFATPIIILVTAGIIYLVNVPAMTAAGDIIDALRKPSVSEKIVEFQQALDRGSFGRQEIVEQLAQSALVAIRQPEVTTEDKKAIVNLAESELIKMTKDKPGDARLHIFLASFYNSFGTPETLEKAREQAAIARELSPNKQSIITEQAVIELQAGNIEKGRDFLKEAYLLDTNNHEALVLYATSLVSLGEVDEAKSLIGTDNFRHFATNDYAVSTVEQSGDYNWLVELLKERIIANPQDLSSRVSLAAAYVELGDKTAAVSTLEEAIALFPQYQDSFQCFIGNIKVGKDPNEGCQ